MLIKDWQDLPETMRNESVRYYYNLLIKKKVSLFLKRLFDLIMSLVLLILLSPIIFILAILIKADSKGRIFYKQKRITQYGKTFKIYKFRTMEENADKHGALVTSQNDSRITRIGHKIRKYRLDEIPQLINVLKGEMSFVGARPEVSKYVNEYTEEMIATLLLPSGITCTSSILFKNEDKMIQEFTKRNINIDEGYCKEILPLKMKENLDYLKNFSIYKDIWICIKTILEVF